MPSLFPRRALRVTVPPLFAALVCVGAMLSSAQAGSPDGQPIARPPAVEATTDRYIVKFRDATSDPRGRMSALSSTLGANVTYLRAMSGGAHVVRIDRNLSLSSARVLATDAMTDPEIQYIEPDRKMYPLLVPNDPQYSSQWNLYEAAGGINAPGAWNTTTGSTSVVIGVIDTGYRPHADLSGKILPGYDFIADTSVSNDGDGRDADASDPGDYGCNGTGNSTWHGTHVSGIAAAASNNGSGIAGVNWLSKVLPVRVLGRCGGYTSDIVDGMRWAAGIAVTGAPVNPNPARVLNLSLGGTGSCGSATQSAVDDVIARGTVVVVAAGNSNVDVSTTAPANCSGVIAVGATTRSGGRASYSNYGTGLTLSAPGSGILSTLNSGATTPGSDSYAYYSGTSMATPHVAGVVSLMLSQTPSLTPAQVKAKLVSSARAFPTGTDADCTASLCGAGIVDAAAAVGGATTISRVNLALASNGASASASSTYSAGYAPSGVINGDRKGANWGAGGGWNDSTPNSFPDWIRIDFPRAVSLSEVDVFSVQDSYQSPLEPTEATTFTRYGLVAFDLQYWNGANWITVPGGTVSGNNLVWKKLTFSPVSTTAIRINVGSALDTWSRVAEIEAYGDAPPTNVASSLNGGVATASSSYSGGYPPSGAIDGDRLGMNWGAGTGWNDGTPNAFPDTLQIAFNGIKTINEIDVFSVQDNYTSPTTPTETMTFTQYGLVNFDVQYWNGSSWVTVPGGSVTGNDKVWRKLTFASISTNAIRIVVNSALGTWSRVAEIQAYTAP